MRTLLPLTLACSALTTGLAFAESKITYTPLNAGYLHSFSTDIDDGGSFSNNQLTLTAGIPLILEDDLTIALTAGFELHSYDFDGGSAGSFATLDPWEDIHRYKLGSYIRWEFKDRWTLTATPSVRISAENGASIGDSITAAATVGAQYKFNENLSLGTGFGFRTKIEDSVTVYPIILIDWKINDALSLTTSPPSGTNFGPTLSLRWDKTDELRFSAGVSYVSRRFRLDSDNTASPDGVGENSGIPLFGAVTWKPSENTQATLVAGVRLASELRLEDEDGDTIRTEDHDPSPFIGLNIGYTF